MLPKSEIGIELQVFFFFLSFIVSIIEYSVSIRKMASLILFPSLAEAQKAQMMMDVPLIVFVHASSEASDEEQTLNPRLTDLFTTQHYRKVFNNDIVLGDVKGRTAQREALTAVLSHGLMNHVVLVHEVQEGTTACSQLVAAVPQFNSVPRVHLLPSRRAVVSSPVVLCEKYFTPGNLILYLQQMLRIPFGGVGGATTPSSSSAPALDSTTAKTLMRNLLDKVEVLDVQFSRTSRTTYVAPPPPPRPSTSPATSATAFLKLPPSSAPSSKKSHSSPGDATVPVLPASVKLPVASPTTNSTGSTIATPVTDGDVKKRPSLPLTKGESSPPTQRNKPEFISVRCSLPSGTSLTIEKLSPSSSSIRENVRPVVRENLGHDEFDLVRVGPPPQRLSREEHEGQPLQEIGITTSSALRVVVHSDAALPQTSAPRPQTVSGGADTNPGRLSSMQGLQSLMGMFNAQNRVSGSAAPPSGGVNAQRPSRPVTSSSSNIRTLDDVLAANQDYPPMGGRIPNGLSPAETPNIMAERLRNLMQRLAGHQNDAHSPGNDSDEQENEENADVERTEATPAPKAFSGNGRRLRDSSEQEKKNS